MGRAAMFVVMGFGVAAGFISMNIRNATNLLTESQVGYYNYSVARNLARTGIQRSLRYIDLNPKVENYTPPTSGSFNGGSYIVSDSVRADTMWLNVTGTYADTNYVMRTKLLRSTKPFPVLTGAVGIRANLTSFQMSGNANIDGNGALADGTDDPSCPDKPGVAVMSASDTGQIQLQGNNARITGVPAKAVDTTTADPGLYMSEYRDNADTTINVPVGVNVTVSGEKTFGTTVNPWITIINVPDTTKNIKFAGKVTGCGILAINGNVSFAGGIKFQGLIVVFGENNTIDYSEAGAAEITGGLIMAGSAVKFKLVGSNSGTGKISYSCEALRNARNLSKLRYYAVLEWYE